MGPLPKEPSDKKDLPNAEDYEQNGWQLGYQVQLNGIGIEGMANDINVEDSDSDGYEGPGDGSDAEVDDNERAGYQPIPFSVVTADENKEAQNEKEDEVQSNSTDQEFKAFEEKIKTASAPPPGMLPSTLQKEVEELKLNAKKIHLKDADLMVNVPASRSKIDLDDAKIDEIKEAVSKISLPPPSWAKDIDDEKLKQILQNIKSSPKI
uniref:Uncharacterized protein n=1 Tax=Panagrolaimus sp. PS1159 TaxID=55785 RepID=A0AC35G8Q4_9BILA